VGKGRTVPAVLVVLLISTVIAAPSVTAFSARHLNWSGCDDESSIRFAIDNSIPTSLRGPIRDGVQRWNNTSSPTGGSEVAVSETAGNITITIERHPTWNSLNDPIAQATCTGRLIQFNEAYFGQNANFFFNVAQHEMGHILELRHTGWDTSPAGDSLDGVRSQMATCGLASDRANRPWSLYAADDSANLLHRWSGYDSVTPNPSFENGRQFWVRDGSGPWSTAAGGPVGNVYLRYRTSGVAGHMVHISANLADESNEVRTRLRMRTEAGSGPVSVRLATRTVDYGTPGCAAFFFSSRDQNQRSVGSWMLRDNLVIYPTATWTQYFGSTYDLPLSEGHDVRIEVHPDVTLGGAQQYINLDNIYVEDLG